MTFRAAHQIGALFVALSTTSLYAAAASRCPLIRPPALLPQQVDEIVLSKASELLRRKLSTSEITHPFKVLDGTEDAILTYSFTALAIGETLGVDSIAAFSKLASTRGPLKPFEVLSIEDLQKASREAYFSGADSPPPPVDDVAEYEIQSIPIRPPKPSLGWILTRCGSENIVFQRGSASSNNLATAYARLVTLPPYKNSEQFTAAVKGAASNARPQGFTVNSTTVAPASGTSMPCTDFELTAASNGLDYRAFGRFCYLNRDSTLGIAALFSQLGSSADRVLRTEAMGFVAGASPK